MLLRERKSKGKETKEKKNYDNLGFQPTGLTNGKWALKQKKSIGRTGPSATYRRVQRRQANGTLQQGSKSRAVEIGMSGAVLGSKANWVPTEEFWREFGFWGESVLAIWEKGVS